MRGQEHHLSTRKLLPPSRIHMILNFEPCPLRPSYFPHTLKIPCPGDYVLPKHPL